jgi:DNA-binding transcriptional ArsR family regulator
MVWQIHFTDRDLAQIQIAPTLGPLAETLFALSLLRCPIQRPPAFGGWRGQVGGRLTAEMKPLAALVPPGSRGVDLHALVGRAPTIEQSADALLAVPHERLVAEMRDFDRQCRLPATAWAVAETGGHARQRLADATQASYRALVEPYWPRARASLEAERARRGRVLMEGGVDQLLNTLQPPMIRWCPPRLEIHFPGSGDVDFRLGGRGLTLIPSLFVGELPCLILDTNDEDAPLGLAFAAVRDPEAGASLWDEARPGPDALPALVGRTRAAALSRIADGCTTTELAQHTGVSLSAASQHATVLRDAGLISTRRHGSAVLHVLTPLGLELLNGGAAGGSRAR